MHDLPPAAACPVAVITGGASSVGLWTARKFVEVGYQVYICDANERLLNDALRNHTALRGTLADVGSITDVDRFFTEVLSCTDAVDVLVNNVGIAGPKADLEDIPVEEWHRVIAANLNGMFYTLRRVLPQMKARRQGSIINISSASTRTALPFRLAYVASKAGVEGLTRALAREVGPYNIRCNSILPGMIDNDRMRAIVARKACDEGLGEQQVLEGYLRYISMGCMVEPEEIADMALFLASPAARHVTGQLIGVDGNIEWET
jgi:NAD(P)-dependent dehydrogenase (short-subunit alcohol dehydrogenase family)